jgi:hypothetical protein
MQNPPNNNEPIIDEEKGPTIDNDAYEKVRHLTFHANKLCVICTPKISKKENSV